ncbi:MAG: hypothetical protein ABGZ17_27340, partial [Planctomycetaceae bacterium]
QSPARYSILTSVPGRSQRPKFGLSDQSARLNLNGLPLSQDRRKECIGRLVHLPGMRPETAAAILDWMDRDDEPSEFGAESSWYSAQKPAYRPRQGRLQSLQELLLVRGVTVDLLCGEDTNRNGILDPQEDDGGTREPLDNADGILQAGWSDLLTIHSAESTLRADGSKKINVNSTDVVSLYDELETQFGRDVARYISALRMKGRSDRGKSNKKLDEDAKLRERVASGSRRLQQQLGSPGEDEGGLDALAKSESISSQVRGGILLSSSSSYQIESLLDLVGGSVRVDIDRVDTLLGSPWADDVSSLERALQELSPHLTVTDNERRTGRVNVFQAPFTVLMTIPGMTESLARSIVVARPQESRATGVVVNTSARQPETIAWLFEQRLLDLRQLRLIAPHITVAGDVFRGVAVGHIDGVRRQVGIRFLIDATFQEPRLMELQDVPPIPLLVDDVSQPARTGMR